MRNIMIGVIPLVPLSGLWGASKWDEASERSGCQKSFPGNWKQGVQS